MSIPIKKIEVYLRTQILPKLGSSWTLCDKDTLMRESGGIIQGICFDPSQHMNALYVHWFIYPLPIATTEVVLTLGQRLKYPKTNGDWLLPWPATDATTDILLSLLTEQAAPPIAVPLTMNGIEAALNTLRQSSATPLHFWALGVVQGLAGQSTQAEHSFTHAAELLSNSKKQWAAAGRKAPDCIDTELNQINQFVMHLKDDRGFKTFCEQEAQQTRKALKITL